MASARPIMTACSTAHEIPLRGHRRLDGLRGRGRSRPSRGLRRDADSEKVEVDAERGSENQRVFLGQPFDQDDLLREESFISATIVGIRVVVADRGSGYFTGQVRVPCNLVIDDAADGKLANLATHRFLALG